MNTVDMINIVVGVLAIILSITAIVLGILGILNAQRAEHALKVIEEKTNNIDHNVVARLDDLIKRAAPSGDEKVFTEVTGEFFKAAIQNPDTLKLLLREGMKAQK